MKILKTLFTSVLLVSLANNAGAQTEDTVIDTLYIFDTHIREAAQFQNVVQLSPKDLRKNTTNLSEVLRFQSPVYIKENGRGGTSSPAFRGTTAQQTAFVWNGININSAFLGQGDINNIGYLTADEMDFKAGGGSVIYGSGAIGGSIHLNNELTFNKGFRGEILLNGGSYETFHHLLKTSYSDSKFSFKFSADYSSSKNDYKVPEKNYFNQNGKYQHTGFNFSTAYRLNSHHTVSWITEFQDGLQHYPIFTSSQIPSQYKTENIYNLVAWDWKQKKWNNSLKVAFTEENFSYFEDIQKPKTSGGKGRDYIIKDNFNYEISPKWKLDFIGEYRKNTGEGYQSGISKIERNALSIAGLLHYSPLENLFFEGGIKKDFVEKITSPVLYSLAGKWKTSEFYTVGFNFSKNFRYPTFNDLYWQPGGNMNLEPEISTQWEMNNEIHFSDFKFSIVPYYMKIENMIRWLPTSKGYWSAFNTDHVTSYGLENRLDYSRKIGENELNANMGYSYTRSQNEENKKQLMYVPLHKIYGMVSFRTKLWEAYIQGTYNGITYTDSEENIEDALSSYFLLNVGIERTLLKHFTLGFKVNNIFDQIYATTAFYYMPKRNYNLSLHINF